MVEFGIEQSDGRMFVPARSAPTILPESAHQLDVAVTKGIQASVEALKRANQAGETEDIVVEFRKTPKGQSKRIFPPGS